MTRIHDLDIDVVIEQIERATDPKTDRSADPLIDNELRQTPRRERVELLRDAIVNAALNVVTSVDELTIEWPLMRALVRVHHHPFAAKSFPKRSLAGVDVGPVFEAMVQADPGLTWNIDDVARDLIQSVREADGDHEVELEQRPWMTAWGRAIQPMFALWIFVTLRKLGDLDFDAWEKGVYDEAIEHYERTKNIKPSRLVKKKDS